MNTTRATKYRSRTRPPERVRPRAANDASAVRGENVTLRDGRELLLRPIHADDAPALQRGFAQLSAEEVRMRFLHLLTELPDQLATRMCDIDPQLEVAYVLTDPDDRPEREIHGVARAYIDPVTDSAEYAVIVQKALTCQGIGHLLLARVIDECRARGVLEIWGDVLAENHAMLHFCDRMGFERSPIGPDATMVRVRLALT